MQTGFNLKPVKDASYLKCETCGKAFSRSWLLKNHQRIHTGERPFKCTYCDRAFSDKSNLRQHMHIHTTKEKLFQCGICDRTFAQRRYLVKHASEIHRDTQLGLLGSPPAKRKRTDEIKIVAAQKVLVDAKGDNQEGTSHKVGEHQYLTRQKTRQVSTDNKEKKYSEQDLKDFIKSNEKTMEKNGFIFIKQNFDQFDSKDKEPTLTEISEVMLTGDVNCFSGQGGAASTNNGKVVQSSPVKITLPTMTTEQKTEKIKHVVVKGRPNSVVKQEVVPIRKIKLNPADTKIGDGKIIVVGTNGQVLKSHPTPTILPQTKSVALNTVSHRPISAQQIQTEPVTYVQFIQPTPMSLVPNNSQVQLVPIIPGVERMVTMPIQNLGQTVLPVDMPGLKVLPPVNTSTKAKLHSTGNDMKIVPVTSTGIPMANSDLKIDVNMLPTISASNLTALPVTNNEPITISNTTPDSVVSDHDNNAKSAELNLNINNSNTTSVLENTITPVCSSAVRPLQIDEKGAVSYFIGSNNHMLASTPSVSDASWQGVLNINSEQELLELINSQSGVPTGIIGDKNVTIYIQNVDAAQGMAPLMLDTQTLPGIANFTEYSEQETIISNVSPDIPNSGDVSLGSNDEPVLSENVIVLDSSMTTVSQKSEINMNRNEVFFSSSAISDGNNLLIDSGIEDQTVKEEEFMVSVPVKDESIEEIEVKTKSSEDFDEENKFVVPQSYEHEEDVDFKNGMQQFKQETDHFEEVNESFDQDVHSPDTFLEPKMEDINEIEEDVEQENVERINVCKDEIEGMEESTCNELNNSTEKRYLNSDHDFYSVPVSSLENGTELEGRVLNTDSYMQGDNELDIDDGMAIRNVAEEYSEQGT